MSKCIYCGEIASTKDHVPPKGLIRQSNRDNLWKVESCRNCNNGASRDEEYFRLIIVGALCHTEEADELFDGPISRSMEKRPTKEGWFFNSLGQTEGKPYIEWAPETLQRVALKIAVGLAHKISVEPPQSNSSFTLEESEGRGEHEVWALDFSFSYFKGRWELCFFDSVKIVIKPA